MKKTRLPLWVPYVKSIEVKNNELDIRYKEGRIKVNAKDILSMMIYGRCAPISMEVFDVLSKSGVPMIYHTRNQSNSIWIHGGYRADRNDILTKQILNRENIRKRTYIAREIIRAKLKGTSKWHYPVPTITLSNKSIAELRNIESISAKMFWDRFYDELGCKGENRRGNNNISKALNATSKFLSGILLRWITYHHLSPYHGFLHQTAEYSSLVYDLIEPYRYIECEAVFQSAKKYGTDMDIIAYAIDYLKYLLNEEMYCVQTRQYIRRQELLHGVCLALRCYLLGLSNRFVIPLEGVPNGGRPMKTNYTLPGKSPGWSKIYRETKLSIN